MTDDQEMMKLKELYDELWHDAKTMIKDMRRSITMYLFSGMIVLAMVFFYAWYAVVGLVGILAGVSGYLVYFTAAIGVLGTVLFVVVGILFVRLYFRLRKRYAKLIGMERESEA